MLHGHTPDAVNLQAEWEEIFKSLQVDIPTLKEALTRFPAIKLEFLQASMTRLKTARTAQDGKTYLVINQVWQLCILSDNEEVIEKFLEQTPSYGELRDTQKANVAHYLAFLGMRELLNKVVSNATPSLNACDACGFNLAHYALLNNKEGIFEWVLRKFPDLDNGQPTCFRSTRLWHIADWHEFNDSQFVFTIHTSLTHATVENIRRTARELYYDRLFQKLDKDRAALALLEQHCNSNHNPLFHKLAKLRLARYHEQTYISKQLRLESSLLEDLNTLFSGAVKQSHHDKCLRYYQECKPREDETASTACYAYYLHYAKACEEGKINEKNITLAIELYATGCLATTNSLFEADLQTFEKCVEGLTKWAAQRCDAAIYLGLCLAKPPTYYKDVSAKFPSGFDRIIEKLLKEHNEPKISSHTSLFMRMSHKVHYLFFAGLLLVKPSAQLFAHFQSAAHAAHLNLFQASPQPDLVHATNAAEVMDTLSFSLEYQSLYVRNCWTHFEDSNTNRLYKAALLLLILNTPNLSTIDKEFFLKLLYAKVTNETIHQLPPLLEQAKPAQRAGSNAKPYAFYLADYLLTRLMDIATVPELLCEPKITEELQQRFNTLQHLLRHNAAQIAGFGDHPTIVSSVPPEENSVLPDSALMISERLRNGKEKAAQSDPLAAKSAYTLVSVERQSSSASPLARHSSFQPSTKSKHTNLFVVPERDLAIRNS